MKNISWGLIFTPTIFFLAFLLVPIAQLNGLEMMPGDIGDARLNNYFLENVYLYLSGVSDSLWHLPFFYPYPYVIGFSENLFGSSPVYLLARFVTDEPHTAYQIWFLAGYIFNFSAAFWALRKLGGSPVASAVGALIFTFALPTTSHAGHAQLHYRFGIPLAVTFFFEFIAARDWRAMLLAFFWMVGQFYAGIYMGFFALLLMASMLFVYIAASYLTQTRTLKSVCVDYAKSWRAQDARQRTLVLVGFVTLLLTLIMLFYPYLQVTQLYGFKRPWSEIARMLPRPQSYFLSDGSLLWSAPQSPLFSDIPMRHEHQMFTGVLPFLLTLCGLVIGIRQRRNLRFVLVGGMLATVVVLTLYVGGFSLWLLFHKLPLASAIRAVTRVDQALLFPMAYLSVLVIDASVQRYLWANKALLLFLVPGILAEFSMTSMPVSTKASWRARIAAADVMLPERLQPDSILFMAQMSGTSAQAELDAMWVALNYNLKTLNGYSGHLPRGFNFRFGTDCAEMPQRVMAHLVFNETKKDTETYRNLMRRVVPVGFANCEVSWLDDMPNISIAKREYSSDEMRALDLKISNKSNGAGDSFVTVKIVNSSDQIFSARSALERPIRLSWRFIDASGQPLSGWDSRINLPEDIPARGELAVRVPISAAPDRKGLSVAVSIVQERVFWGHNIWGHNIGIESPRISWN